MTISAEQPSPDALVQGQRLARNALYNVLGLGLPTLIALVTIPLLIGVMGETQFGVLMLAWMTIGYFSIFDMGLGRAMTQFIARQLGQTDRAPIPAMFWTGLGLMTMVGLVGAVIASAISPWLVGSVLKVPEALQAETLWSFYLVAFGLPLVVSGAGLQGVVEAHQRFGVVFCVKLTQGAVTFIGPLVAALLSDHLAFAVGSLLAARLASWAAFLMVCLSTIPGVRDRFRFEPALVKPMMTYGGWMTITNVLNPVFTYADRFLLGAMASMAAVAHYVVPWEMIVKLSILPVALMGVVFPALAGTYVRDPRHTADLFSRTLRYLYLIMMPVVIAGIGFAPELLRAWLGHEFAVESFRVMQWLLLGVLFYGLSRVPFGLLQAIGRPDVAAKFHMVEAPLYVLVLWLLVSRLGVEGAAIAWGLRAATEAALLMIAAGYFLRSAARKVVSNLLIGGVTAFGLSFLVLATGPPVVRAGVAVTALAGFVLLSWRIFLQPAERDLILKHLHPRAWRRLLQPSGAS